MADQEPLDTTSQDDDHLPERIRVHALAKRLGVTSKRILAKLGELGNEVRSPQSSVDRAVAESVRASLTTAPRPVTEPGLFEAGAGTAAAATPENTAGAAAGAETTEQTADPEISGHTAAGESAGEADAETGQTPGIAAEPVAAGAALWSPAESVAPETAVGDAAPISDPDKVDPAAAAPPGDRATVTEPATGAAGAMAQPGAESTGLVADPMASPASVAGAEEDVADSDDTAGTAATAVADAADGPVERDPNADSGTGMPDTATTVSVSGTVTTDAPSVPEVQSAAFGAAANLFASPVPEEPTSTEPVVFEGAVVSAPLFLSPDAAAAEDLRRRRKTEQPTEPERGTDSDTDAAADEQSDTSGDSGDADDQPRRRRRGRRGRGRGRGEQQSDAEGETDDGGVDAADSADDDRAATADTTESDAESGSPADEPEGGSSRRRRRRRRRKVGGDSGEADSAADDPPNTVVHEREPRNKNRARAAVDEVQGITGSTRLEAKRQRRRDGREAGRRRPPILTESEFLARRESVDRVMVVREKEFPGHAPVTQVAVLEDKVLVEHFVTSTGSASMVGNVYLGKVQNVLPSMEAAFVDIGRGRNGVLYAGEVNWEAAGLGGKERKIEQALKPGDQVLVQVSKDPVGHKGARLTTQISLAGRFLVYVPAGTSTGISRKLPDTERKRLKEILREIVPADAGVIIRTAAEGVSEAELTRDVERLQATWRTITAAAETRSNAPKTLYEEPDLLVKVVRDLFNEDFTKLVIEGERSWNTVESYIGTVAPDLLARVAQHENTGVDVFEAHRIDEQLAKALDRKVWLPSGGTLVIDRTEAMTVIDVNTGKFTGSGGGNLEETVTRNNLEAAEEIVRQMRLRDIGGMIVVDFIDMVLESNRDLVLRRLTEALGRDRTRHQVSEVTSLGLVQMTRKKLGTGLVEAFSTTCEHCHGRGIHVHSYPVEQSGSDEGSGRGRESGSRRRRHRDKSSAATPQPAPAPAAEHAEEDAAAKRAHPVALAMAAHQSDEAAAETSTDADTAETADRTAPAETGAAALTDATTDIEAQRTDLAAADAQVASATEGATAPVREPRRRRGRVRRAAGAATASGDRPAVESNGRVAHAATGAAEANGHAKEAAAAESAATSPEPAGAAAGSADALARDAAVSTEAGDLPGAETAVDSGRPPAADVSPVAAASAEPPAVGVASVAADSVAGAAGSRSRRRRVARSTSAPAADTAGAVFVVSAAEQSSDTAAPESDTVAAEPADQAAAVAPEPVGSAAVSADVPARDAAVATGAGDLPGAVAEAPADSARSSAAGSAPVAADVAPAAAETTQPPAMGVTPIAADTEAGAPGSRSRRRRVARSTSAPAADTAGAVFVVSAAEQSSEPAVPEPEVEEAAAVPEPPAAEVPVRRARRRAVGRPAGPPVDEED